MKSNYAGIPQRWLVIESEERRNSDNKQLDSRLLARRIGASKIYTLGQRALRRALEEAGAMIRHQTGKQTERPTLRWVFQLFQAVHLLIVDGVKRISNLSEERVEILSFLGRSAQRYYLLL